MNEATWKRSELYLTIRRSPFRVKRPALRNSVDRVVRLEITRILGSVGSRSRPEDLPIFRLCGDIERAGSVRIALTYWKASGWLFRGDGRNLRNRNGAAAADKFDRAAGTRVAGRVTGENDVCSTGRGGVSTYRGRRGPRNGSVSPKPRDIPTHLIAFNRHKSHRLAPGSRDSISTPGRATPIAPSPIQLQQKRRDMEQGGVSIIAPPGITDNSVGKSKSIGITFRTNPTIQAAKEKLKTPWLSSLMQEDATAWETLMIGLGEMIGTAILVFIGCTGCIGSMDSVPSNLQISLTFGFAVMIAIQCVGHISGAHLNPAITVAAVILGKKSLPMAALYICAQCVGSLLGFGLLKLITPPTLLYSTSLAKADSFCTTDVYHGLKTNEGFLVEILATAVLVLFACGLWDYRNVKNTDSVSIRFGLCIAVLCMVFIPYTGSSMNPARSLGPAIWNGYWDNHWIYWVGPICGAIVAALLYRCLFLCKRNPERQSNGNLRGVET